MPTKLLGRKIDTLIFDVDGTFYHHSLIPIIWGEVRRLQAIHLLKKSRTIELLTEEEIVDKQTEYVSKSKSSGSFSETFSAMGGSDFELYQIIDSVDRRKFLSPDPALHSMFAQLQPIFQLGLLTSSTEYATDNICGYLLKPEWGTNFSAVHCLNTPGINWHKPQPEAFSEILSVLDTQPERSVMVGDDRFADLVPARSLGMLTVQVGLTDFPEADLQIDKVTDLLKHLNFS